MVKKNAYIIKMNYDKIDDIVIFKVKNKYNRIKKLTLKIDHLILFKKKFYYKHISLLGYYE